jgi:5-methylcytosine-specific restriction protein B
MSLILPVSGNIFQVPENIMIIGTMNTADRSIALLDTALRRRFGFIELMPDVDVLEDNVLEGIPLRLWLKTLNQRICKNIGKDARNLQIGHAYLMHNGKTINSFKKFAQIIQEDIIPLLEEYCYEDYAILEKLLGTALIDNAQMRIRNEIFEDTDTKKLTTALLATCPELSTSEPSVDSELEDEADEEGNEDIDSNES